MLQEQITLPNGAIIQDRRGEHYVVEARLGQGGFSAVYRVRDRRTKSNVFALKEVIDPKPQERRNLAFEAGLLMRLEHPSLPRVYQVFEHVRLNRIFMLMDYIDGKNLETLREEQPEHRFSLSQSLAMMTPIVDAVAYLHKQNRPVVHRDIKPANIIITSALGDAYLVDFGLAKEFVAEKTTNVFRYGTPGYAAPEQYGQGTNPRTDVYALGATLYTLLTGAIPTDALTRSINRQDHLDPCKRADEVYPGVPKAVAQVIERAMSLRNEDRFDTVEEFWQALRIAATQKKTELIAPDPLSVHEPGLLSTNEPALVISARPRRAALSRKQKIWLAVVLILTFIVVSIEGIFVFGARSHPSPTSTVSKRVTTVSGQQRVGDCALPALPTVVAASRYPQLAPCYGGTIVDIGVTREKTNLFLTNVKQQNDQISGMFIGLQQTAPFTGYVTDKEIHFKVSLQGLKETLSFDGDFNVGQIIGSFSGAYNDTGQFTGDQGSWTLLPVAPSDGRSNR